MRPKLKHFVLVLVLLPFFMAPAPAAGSDMLRLESSLDAMGSTYSVVLYGTDRSQLGIARRKRRSKKSRRLDDELSNYKPDSPWSLVNRFAAERPVAGSGRGFRSASGVPGLQPRRARALSTSRSGR